MTQIRLSNTAAELKAGETVNLTATVLPEDATDKSVIYTSVQKLSLSLVQMVLSRPFRWVMQ